MVKIFVIDEHPVIRQGLASVLEKYPDFKFVGDASSAKDAMFKIEVLKPDLIIMDAFKSGNDSINDIKMIRQRYDQIKIVVITDSRKEADFMEAISAGVRGYLLKASEVNELVDTIRLVADNGAVVYSSKIIRQIDSRFHEANSMDRLSQREKEILEFVAKGCSNKDIAGHCFVSEATVKAHMRRIMEKLNVKNRAEAVSIGIKKGVLEIAYQ